MDTYLKNLSDGKLFVSIFCRNKFPTKKKVLKKTCIQKLLNTSSNTFHSIRPGDNVPKPPLQKLRNKSLFLTYIWNTDSPSNLKPFSCWTSSSIRMTSNTQQLGCTSVLLGFGWLTWLTSSAVSSPLLTQSSLAKEPLETFETREALSLNGVSSSDPLEPPESEDRRFSQRKYSHIEVILFPDLKVETDLHHLALQRNYGDMK